MHLKRLTLLNFKNIEQATLDFEPGINAFVGDNGAGKSNILDAIYYLSMCKSSLATRDSQNVRHDNDFFVVDGEYSSDEGRREAVVCSFTKQRGAAKVVKRNGKEYERLSDHVGLIPVVVVSPYDTSIIWEADERRKFLNSFISQIDSSYLNALIKYNTLITQRNRLLKSGGDESVLLIYDQQIQPYADLIFSTRRDIIAKITPLVEEFYARLSGAREEVSLSYQSALLEGEYLDLMLAARRRDIALEYTTVGVHRDDLNLSIGGMQLKKYGSQGQQKSLLIALKLAQYMLVSEIRCERPILLLDDLFDKLDAGRVEQLMYIVSGEEFGQIFITDCNRTRLNQILGRMESQYQLFDVDYGVPSQHTDTP